MTTTAAAPRKRRLRDAEDGATAVEAAFVLSILIFVVLLIINFGQTFYIWNTLQLVVGQTSRNVIVQNGILGGSGCDATCAETALQKAIQALLGSTPSICATPTAGQYCVNASISTAMTTTTMTLSAMYGFEFLSAYTLVGQITVPIGLPPDPAPPPT
jgi:Flp pilus assembly protein TadG